MSKDNKHKFTPEQLSAYLDGQLGEAQRRELEQHLRQCPECEALLEEMSRTDQAVQQAEQVTAPRGYFDTFGSGVANRIAARKLETRKAPWLVRWGWLPAAATLAGLALVLIRGDFNQKDYFRPELRKAPEPPVAAVSQPRPEPREQAKGMPMAKESRQVPGDEIGAVEDKIILAPAPAEKSAEQKLAETALTEKEDPAAAGSAAKDMEVERPVRVESSRKMASAESPMALKSVAPAAPAAMAPAVKEKAETPPAPIQTPPPKQKTEAPVPIRARDSTAPAKPAATGAFRAPPGVSQVEVIMICLPDGKPDCPEPKVEKVIEISVPGM